MNVKKAKSGFGDTLVVRNPNTGDPVALLPPVDPDGRGYNSPASPTNLRYARSHKELAGRKSPSLASGLSLKEPLETEDYWNWD